VLWVCHSVQRVLGLIGKWCLPVCLGPENYLDAFRWRFVYQFAARDWFAEGALSTAFITTFSKKIAIDGDAIGMATGQPRSRR